MNHRDACRDPDCPCELMGADWALAEQLEAPLVYGPLVDPRPAPTGNFCGKPVETVAYL